MNGRERKQAHNWLVKNFGKYCWNHSGNEYVRHLEEMRTKQAGNGFEIHSCYWTGEFQPLEWYALKESYKADKGHCLHHWKVEVDLYHNDYRICIWDLRGDFHYSQFASRFRWTEEEKALIGYGKGRKLSVNDLCRFCKLLTDEKVNEIIAVCNCYNWAV